MTEEVYTAGSTASVTTEWLREHLGDDGLITVDVRVPYFFGQGHLPGAVNLPPFLLQSQSGGPPQAPQLARRLGALGVRRTSHVVAYDEGGSPAAALLYWVLRYFRHPRVSVLDGGITLWSHAGDDLEYTSGPPAPQEYHIGTADPSVFAQIDEVRHALDDEQTLILDVRSPAEFLGLQQSAGRNGHIPGAVNLEWSNLLEADEDGLPRLRSEETLRQVLGDAGVTPDRDIIVHCNSGVRSSHTFLVLDALAYPRVRNYVGGWQDWGNRTDTPVDEA